MNPAGSPAYNPGNDQDGTNAVAIISSQSGRGSNMEEEKDDAPTPRGMDLLLAPRSYSSSDDDDVERSVDSSETTRALSGEDDEEDCNDGSVVMATGQLEQERFSASIDDLDLSLESLRLLAHQRGLDTKALNLWGVLHDGSLMDPEQHKYHSLRDALRAYSHLMHGVIPREDMYYLAILRRKLAELELPLVDGPISVTAFGSIIPEDHFYTSKKLFPIGYETLVKVQLNRPMTIAFRLRCKIVHGNKKKAPIFVVELEKSAVEVVFRSYVASKAWKKALVHFVSLSADELAAIVSESSCAVEIDGSGKPVDALTPASGEDGFGLLRRNITRVLEGLHRVFWCKEYQFWEQRHPITSDVHAKIRSRLRNQMKEAILSQTLVSEDALNRLLAPEVVLQEHCRDPDEEQRRELQEEKEQREADKRSVREAARKLLEIEIKAQEDAKKAQRRANEERKNAIIKAKMEATRQKEARKEALRLAKEEEKRLREGEKEVKRALREEEKRKKMEDKENSMKRRIEELRQRRLMREEQKAILENGVVTSVSPRQSSDLRKRKVSSDAQQQHLALLNFVSDERERRRQIRLWTKRNEVEDEVWTRVKARYTEKLRSDRAFVEDKLYKDTKFPSQVISPAVELDAVPSETHADLLFVWDFISTFSDCLKLPALPSLGVFVDMMTLKDDSSPVGDGDLDDDSLGTLYASLHAELLKVLISEYFPLLQLGNTLEEFHRTRPMNVFSWPEVARQVCQMAMEFKHPSADEQLLKSIKGSKSYRDDAVTHPLRQKLHRRGCNLLKKVPFEEEKEEVDADALKVHVKNSVTLASELSKMPTLSSDYYGVVLVSGVSSKFKVGEKNQHLVVTEILATCNDSVAMKEELSASIIAKVEDDNADRLRAGDYLMYLNGQDVRGMSPVDFNSLVNGFPSPHGLLMSSIVPVPKNSMKHIVTTHGATKLKCCGFVLKLLRAKEIAAPFNQPVDAELYPDYYSSGDIVEPMDLGTISEKIDDEDYEHDDVESFVDDVQLVWKNCYTYNSLKADISNHAQKLSVIFERLMKEWVYTTVNRPLIAAEEDNCRNCQTIHAKGRLLLCDRCDAPYHTFCLKSPLSVVPTSEWFCPTCLADPSFSPEQFRKKARDIAADSRGNSGSELKESALTDMEKRLLIAIDLLSGENYAKLAVGDRLKVLRVLCELFQETSAVQSLYHSLEEKANDARKKFGESLADLEREWDRFSPPHLSHGVEQTKKFIIDGNEHDLTDELLTYLEDKAKAELGSEPLPLLPSTAKAKQYEKTETMKQKFVACNADDDDDTSETSEADEIMIFEEFSEQYLEASHSVMANATDEGNEPTLLRPLCYFCGLEDEVLNGPLHRCKQSPLTGQTSLLDQFEIPDLLSKDRPDMLIVRTLKADDVATAVLEDSAEGVQYLEPSAHNSQITQGKSNTHEDSVKKIVYAINDHVVFGMSRSAIQDHLRAATQPINLYLTSLPGEAVLASVSIVKCHELWMGLNLASYESLIFVQSYTPQLGFGELSGQAFPGDVLLMVNGVTLRGKEVAEVEAMLRVDNLSDVTYAVFVRQPSTKMKKASQELQLKVYDLPFQRAKMNTFLATQASGPLSYEVEFQDGPLGLALALEPRGVVVKSLNDHSDGTLGQASLDGRISCGDLVERVNGATYGLMSDLSQFTSWLLSLKRPLKISFLRQPLTNSGQPKTFEQATKLMTELLANSSLLCKHLNLSKSSVIKTFRFESYPLPFEAENMLNGLGIISTNGIVYCEQPLDQTIPVTVAVGDLIVGLNGNSVAGLSWDSVKTLCREMSSMRPANLHFTPTVRPMTLLQAHESCVESANVAWSECESILPRNKKARELESYLKWLIIPRTLGLGKCRNGYIFYRFYSDRLRLFVLSPEKKWSVCAKKEQLLQLIAYLNENSRDSNIASQIKLCFHWILHNDGARLQLHQGVPCCEYSTIDCLHKGPFSIAKEVLLVTDGDMEKYESIIRYYGRKFFLGSFGSQQDAESALKSAEKLIYSTGSHVVIAEDVLTLRTANFPSSLTALYPKAESVVRRILSRKYEFGGLMDGQGGVKLSPISHDVYSIMKRGLRSHKAMMKFVEAATIGMYQAGMPQVAVSGMQGDLQSSAYIAAQARYQEALKRKYAQMENLHAQQVVDSKRTRYADTIAAARMQQQLAPGKVVNPVSFKRSLQALVDQGRAMLAAWNQFAASATVQTTNALAYACLASFEEVKKVVTRIVVDPSATCPDPKTFVCLHHAYVMGLVCAMATQALTTSQKSPSDSSLVKQVADAFATAILSCVDPSNMLRARALNGFAAAAKKCEPSQRAGDLSVELHNVANFVLMFLRTTRYLSGTSFDDLSSCRPLFTASTPGVNALPASFVQQVHLVENIRKVFYFNVSSNSSGSLHPPITQTPSVPYGTTPGSTSLAMRTNLTQPNKASIDSTFVNVEFGLGPLGIVINYSNRGAIVVTEYSNDNNHQIGQAQASGKVQIGDEVYAVNGQRLEVIGMEGFKAAVATSKRPVLVTFRKFPSDTINGVGGTMSNIQVSDAASTLRLPVSDALQGIAPNPLLQNSLAMNQQGQQPNVYNQEMATMNPSAVYVNAPNVSACENFPSSAPEQFHPVADNMNAFSYPSAPLNQPTGDLNSQFTNPSLHSFMGDLTGQSFPMDTQNYNSQPSVYGAATSVPDTQPSGGWQGAPLNLIAQPFLSGPAQNEMIPNGSCNMTPLDPMPSMSHVSAEMNFLPAPPQASEVSDSFQSVNSTEELVDFVSGNDPKLPPGDSSQVNYYDANGTTYRAAGKFEIDTRANTSNKFESIHDESAEEASADVDTEPESPSVSQMTTPAQSDTDGERGEAEADRQCNRADQLVKLTSASNALQSESIKETLPAFAQNLTTANYKPSAMSKTQPSEGTLEGKPPLQTARQLPRYQAGGKEVRLTEEISSRRSSRVSRKITNIADMYDPDIAKAHIKGGVGSGNDVGMDDPTDGDIGELSTELLEPFSTTIRPLKKDLPRSLRLLGAQLLTMECAIPRDAFRFGRWGRPVRAAWAEMVYTCDTSAVLTEAIVALEANIDPEWLDPCWKTSPLPSAKNAIATATIASAAMRLYSLDDAISYGRMKRGGKRKQRNSSSAGSSRPGSPQKTAIISQKEKASESVSNPSELPFVGQLSTGLVALADKMIHNILETQRERSWTAYAYRKATNHIAAITSLTDDQIEQWIQASADYQAHVASTAGQLQNGVGRHTTPKRKHSGAQPSTSSGQRSSSSRKRRGHNSGSTASIPVDTPQEKAKFVELRCFQMKTLQHCFPIGCAQDLTLRSRLEHILDFLLKNELAMAFSAPVNVHEVPGYAQLIKQPMDLGTIKFKLSRGFYDQRFELLVHDVNLVWENCFTFNCLDADISKCANRLRSIFNRLFEQWITNVRPNTPVTHLASEEMCRQCGHMNAQESMLLCDSCDAAYHAFCLQPPLLSIPPGNWFCPRCPLQKFQT